MGIFCPLACDERTAHAMSPNGTTQEAAVPAARTPFFSGAKPSSRVHAKMLLAVHHFGNPCRKTLPTSFTLTCL